MLSKSTVCPGWQLQTATSKKMQGEEITFSLEKVFLSANYSKFSPLQSLITIYYKTRVHPTLYCIGFERQKSACKLLAKLKLALNWN